MALRLASAPSLVARLPADENKRIPLARLLRGVCDQVETCGGSRVPLTFSDKVSDQLLSGCASRGHNIRINVACEADTGSQAATIGPRQSGAGMEQTGSEAEQGAMFVRPHLRRLKAYTPIEPFEVLSEKLGRKASEIVKLDANENPYGPPPEVLAALSAMAFPHIYPDPETRRLREALSQDCGVPAQHLLVGCGADELIDLIMRCTLDPGDCIIDCPPTFTMYAFDADVNAARVIKVPRNPHDFSIDVAGIKAAVEQHHPKLIFLTSPNNPDGSVLKDAEFEAVVGIPGVLVVLDEAYIEFSGIPSRIPLVLTHPNLCVLRTFSKRAGLAGLRVGYGAFPLGLVEYLWRAKQPYNVSVAGETAACAALSNPAYLHRVRDALVGERERLSGLLREQVPFLHPHPSHANFILCTVQPPWTGKHIKAELAERGIMVRHYSQAELCKYVRISVGKPEHTDALLAALGAMAQQGPPS